MLTFWSTMALMSFVVRAGRSEMRRLVTYKPAKIAVTTRKASATTARRDHPGCHLCGGGEAGAGRAPFSAGAAAICSACARPSLTRPTVHLPSALFAGRALGLHAGRSATASAPRPRPAAYCTASFMVLGMVVGLPFGRRARRSGHAELRACPRPPHSRPLSWHPMKRTSHSADAVQPPQRDVAVSLHAQISHSIRERIVSGQWPPNYRLPPEPDLAKQLGVSRGTLRRALETLIGEGALRQVVGRGTFVISTVIEPAIAQKLSTLSEDLAAQGILTTTSVLDVAVVEAPKPITSLLDVVPGQGRPSLGAAALHRQWPHSPAP